MALTRDLANIDRGPRANLEGEPSALPYVYAALLKEVAEFCDETGGCLE
jgi:hypothetical protein